MVGERVGTWPPLVVEMILVVPPHCFTYHRNQSAEISWVSAVTHRFTKRVASCLADLLRKNESTISKCGRASPSYSGN